MNDSKTDTRKTYEYVYEYFSDQILSGKLKIHDKIPPERDIAQELGVSRNSVREVLHILEINGLIECLQGSGNYVRCDPQEYMMKSVHLMISLLNIRYTEVFDLRYAYEMTAIKLAMDHISSLELEQMHDILVRMDDKSLTARESAELDIAFHNKLLNASGNRLLILYTQMISNLMDQFIKDFRAKILMNPDRARALRSAHWEIYRALSAGDKDGDRAAMEEHFRVVKEEMDSLDPEELNHKE